MGCGGGGGGVAGELIAWIVSVAGIYVLLRDNNYYFRLTVVGGGSMI